MVFQESLEDDPAHLIYSSITNIAFPMPIALAFMASCTDSRCSPFLVDSWPGILTTHFPLSPTPTPPTHTHIHTHTHTALTWDIRSASDWDVTNITFLMPIVLAFMASCTISLCFSLLADSSGILTAKQAFDLVVGESVSLQSKRARFCDVISRFSLSWISV